jgi:hypothetical protein
MFVLAGIIILLVDCICFSMQDVFQAIAIYLYVCNMLSLRIPFFSPFQSGCVQRMNRCEPAIDQWYRFGSEGGLIKLSLELAFLHMQKKVAYFKQIFYIRLSSYMQKLQVV